MASWQSTLLNLFLRLSVKRKINPHARPADSRARVNRIAARFNKERDWIQVTPAIANGIPGEWVEATPPNQHADTPHTDKDARPADRAKKILLYLHGGGYIVCSPLTHRYLVARLCRDSGLRALVVDYRLAPEHPFPAAVEDAETAYRWLLDQGHAPHDIVVAGDSAGGGLTLALLLTLKDKGLPLPAGAGLFSPWTDLALTGWTMLTKARQDPMLRLDSASLGARHYLQGTSPTHPLASPLYADLTGLPPLFVQVGEREILLDDSRRLVDKAHQHGVTAELETWPGMPHVFQAFAHLPEAGRAVRRMGTFLQERAGAHPQVTAAPMPAAPMPAGPMPAAALSTPAPAPPPEAAE